MIEKISMESKNLLTENIEKVAELFPACLVETEEGKKIDFDILKQELSEDIVEGSRERYHLDFSGKKEAIVEANRKTTKTLRPLKDKSVDFDNTKNIYIEGDNLEALKILQESYLGKIKCIYIDPPYNTGNDFVYNDKFYRSTKEEMIADGRMDEDGNILISKDINNDSNGRYHSDWLKMMYPRLKLARNLLSDDGVIFISISDEEAFNLKNMSDEIFGNKNFLVDVIWNSTKSVTNTAIISVSHTHNLVYFKNIDYYVNNRTEFRLPDNGEGFDNPDNDPRGPWKADPFQVGGWRPNQQYEIINPNTGDKYLPNKNCSWKNDYSHYLELVKDNRIVFGKNGLAGPQRKRFLYEAEERGKVAKSIWDDIETTTNGTQLLKKIFDNMSFFDNPKPVELIMRILQLISGKNFIALDFFSGSATTAHAVMKLNAEDQGNRKFILIQLPEATEENSEAYKAGYKTICDIGEERIRRAGKKIKEENPLITKDLDIGFRVYKVDDSNMKDIYYTPDKIDQQNILDMVSNVKEDRKALDLLTQVMLNLGLPLDLHIEEKKIDKNKVFFVEKNSLVACFDDKVDISILDEISKVSPLKICLRESSFIKDQDKINFFERLKKLSPDTEVTII